MESGAHSMTFGDATYVVTGLPTVDAEGEDPHVSSRTLVCAEFAIVHAAFMDGNRDPLLLKFARKVLRHSVLTLSRTLYCSQSEIRGWESGATPIPRGYAAAMQEMLHRREVSGFVARRVTV